MRDIRNLKPKILFFPQPAEENKSCRKSDLNRNKEGSVREINGKVYVDFIYLGTRVRESSGLPWSHQNAKEVRQQLDKIMVDIRSGEFCFSEVFRNSKKKEYFLEKERVLFGTKHSPIRCFLKVMPGFGTVCLKIQVVLQSERFWGTGGILNFI